MENGEFHWQELPRCRRRCPTLSNKPNSLGLSVPGLDSSGESAVCHNPHLMALRGELAW